MLALPDSANTSHLRKAILLALVLHGVLALLLPDLPKFTFSTISRDGGINVFLTSPDKDQKKEFEQSLNQPRPLPDTLPPLVEAANGSASPTPGDQSLVSEESPQVESQQTDPIENDATGKTATAIQPRILFSRSLITRFAQQEAVRYAQDRPDEIERFRRSFSSYRSYRRRNKSDSYANRYGDYYVRNSSSAGDVCFVQKREGIPEDYGTKTVYFFRCDSKPLKLKLPSNSNDS